MADTTQQPCDSEDLIMDWIEQTQYHDQPYVISEEELTWLLIYCSRNETAINFSSEVTGYRKIIESLFQNHKSRLSSLSTTMAESREKQDEARIK